jgi:hypothetical protein
MRELPAPDKFVENLEQSSHSRDLMDAGDERLAPQSLGVRAA